MSKLVKFGRPEITVFNPNEMAINDAKADAVIAWAKRVKEWPTLEKAVDAKIEDQREFVSWWEKKVRRAGGDQKSKTNNADRG